MLLPSSKSSGTFSPEHITPATVVVDVEVDVENSVVDVVVVLDVAAIDVVEVNEEVVELVEVDSSTRPLV